MGLREIFLKNMQRAGAHVQPHLGTAEVISFKFDM